MSGRELVGRSDARPDDVERDAAPGAQQREYRWAPPSPRRARRARRRRLTGVAVTVAVVLGLAGAAVPLTLHWMQQQAADAHGTAAAQTVREYLEAVAAGEAARALTFVVAAPAPVGLLSDEGLAASTARAPLSAIEVAAEPIEGTEGRVSASYRLGETPVTAVFDVVDTAESGRYRIASLPRLDLGDRLQGLPITVDATAVTGREVVVLPGLYDVAVTSDLLTLAGAEPVLVTGTGTAALPAAVTPALSEAGVTAFREAVTRAVNGCLASRALAAGCGLDLPPSLADGTTLYDGSVFRVLTPDAQARLAAMAPALDPSDPAVAMSEPLGAVDAVANCTQGEVNGECDIVPAPGLGRASITMLDASLAVHWG